MNAKDRLIVALDFSTGEEALDFAGNLVGTAQWMKIGLELFCKEGPSIVQHVTALGFDVMLDLKLHDIPKTIERTTKQVAGLGAKLLTIHTGGGSEMMRAAALGAGGRLGLLGVTVLTSMEQASLAEVCISGDIADVVLARTKLAKQCGLAGVVASPLEAASIRGALGDDFEIVTPGVRPTGADVGDQKRIATPAKAIANGASRLVVGRPIRDAKDPKAATRQILDEIA